MTLQHRETDFHTEDITSEVANYAPLITLHKLDLRQDGTALVDIQVEGEISPRQRFYVEETVSQAAEKVREMILQIYLSLIN